MHFGKKIEILMIKMLKKSRALLLKNIKALL